VRIGRTYMGYAMYRQTFTFVPQAIALLHVIVRRIHPEFAGLEEHGYVFSLWHAHEDETHQAD